MLCFIGGLLVADPNSIENVRLAQRRSSVPTDRDWLHEVFGGSLARVFEIFLFWGQVCEDGGLVSMAFCVVCARLFHVAAARSRSPRFCRTIEMLTAASVDVKFCCI